MIHTRLLGFAPLLALLCGMSVAQAQNQPAPDIASLAPEDLRPGCGCSFYAAPNSGLSRSAAHLPGPVLHWSYGEREWGRAKLDGEIRRLKLLQEKRLPEAHDPPRYGDRLVLIFQEDRYHVEVASSVVRACHSKQANCSSTGYRTEMMFRRGGEAPRVLQGSAECSC